MALIKCDECNKEVSDRADACPNCGNPISEFLYEDQVTTIQKTYKVWKLLKLLSWTIIILGLIGLSSANETIHWAGVSGIGYGVLGLFIAKLGAWWTNG